MVHQPDKDFKTTLLNMLRKDVEKVKKMMCKQNGNINKEIEYLKRNISEAENTTSGMKILLEGFKGRFKQAEESVHLKTGQWKLLSLSDGRVED